MHRHGRILIQWRKARIPVIALALDLVAASTTMAGNGAFVWTASKSGEAVVMRPALALTSPGRFRLGLESTLVAADATSAGTVAAPLAVWSEMDLAEPGATSTLGMRLDARSGAGRAVLRQQRSVSTESGTDLSFASALEAGHRANGRSAFVARQEVKLDFPDLGAALAGSAVLDNAAPVSASLKIEQRLPLGISLSATVDDLSTAPNAVFRAGVSGRW